jgi:hypothetical protein
MLDRPLIKALLGLTKNPRRALRRSGDALRDRLAPATGP